MFAVIYYSEATRSFSEEELYRLAQKASSNNEQLFVSGFLQYKKGHFLQYLEGEEAVVCTLMDTIKQDGRHTVTRILQLPDIERRRFKTWHMRYWTFNEFTQIELADLLEEVLLELDGQIYEEECYAKKCSNWSPEWLITTVCFPIGVTISVRR